MHEPITNDVRANELDYLGDPADDIRHVGGDVLTVDEDDVPRTVPNRAEKRRLLRKLGRLPAGRTGRPWPFVRKTGRPEIYGQILLARLRALGDLSKGETA